MNFSKYSKTQIYFPGLNALRFIAAGTVVIVHTEQIKALMGLGNIYSNPSFHLLGSLAVTFFFVLSGYLITYLLLVEKNTYTHIHIRNFYIRRALRIWPLYYLIIFLSFFVLNQFQFFSLHPNNSGHGLKNFFSSLSLYILLLPNLAAACQLAVVYANPLWSIGVEEQFYLFWPWAAAKLNRQRFLLFICSLPLVMVVSTISVNFLYTMLPGYAKLLKILYNFLLLTRLDSMAIGGLAAYYVYFQPQSIKNLFQRFRYVELIVLAVLVAMVLSNAHVPAITNLIYSILFAYLVTSISFANKSFLRMESKRWNSLGNASYGIYLWHFTVLGCIGIVLRNMGIHTLPAAFSAILYLLGLPLTTIVALFSYKYIETPFLKLKNRFMLVKSSTALIN